MIDHESDIIYNDENTDKAIETLIALTYVFGKENFKLEQKIATLENKKFSTIKSLKKKNLDKYFEILEFKNVLSEISKLYDKVESLEDETEVLKIDFYDRSNISRYLA